jgi:hypothetical protein
MLGEPILGPGPNGCQNSRANQFFGWAIFDSHPNMDILFAVTEFLGTCSQVPLLLVIDAI